MRYDLLITYCNYYARSTEQVPKRLCKHWRWIVVFCWRVACQRRSVFLVVPSSLLAALDELGVLHLVLQLPQILYQGVVPKKCLMEYANWVTLSILDPSSIESLYGIAEPFQFSLQNNPRHSIHSPRLCSCQPRQRHKCSIKVEWSGYIIL